MLKLVATLPTEITTAFTDIKAFWEDNASLLMIAIGTVLLAWALLKRGVRRA